MYIPLMVVSTVDWRFGVRALGSSRQSCGPRGGVRGATTTPRGASHSLGRDFRRREQPVPARHVAAGAAGRGAAGADPTGADQTR